MCIGDSKQLNHAIEFLLFELMIKREGSLGSPYIMHLNRDKGKLDLEFGKAIKSLPDLDLNDSIHDMEEVFNSRTDFDRNVLSIKDINSLSQ